MLQAVSNCVGDGEEGAGLSSCFCLVDFLTSALWDAPETIAHRVAQLLMSGRVALSLIRRLVGHILVGPCRILRFFFPPEITDDQHE